MRKTRVLYILHHFPQISETYIRSEIEAIQEFCDVRVVSLRPADLAYSEHVPYDLTDSPQRIRSIIEEFAPDVLHAHWLQQVPALAYFGGYFDQGGTGRAIPFTVRAHSFDTLGTNPDQIGKTREIINSELCLGVLSFPFTRALFEKAGVRGDKIVNCWPVVNYRRFYDPSPNGDGVMNVGACLPKKQMSDFVQLASRHPGREFSLYAMGYNVRAMEQLNAAAGSPVRVVPAVEPTQMPAHYKKHSWLVYTAAHEYNTVGWPMAIAEAQAAGLGVCLPNLRPDLREYVGPSGYLYDSIAEVSDIIALPVSEEARQIGFEHARKSDVLTHRHLLLELWQKAAPQALPQPVSAETFPWHGLGLNWSVRERTEQALRELSSVIPSTGSVVVVDEGLLQGHHLPTASVTSLTHQDGDYWGPPEDGPAAIARLNAAMAEGADLAAFVWPSFWWLEHYRELDDYLSAKGRCLLRTQNVVVFALPAPNAAKAA